MRPKKPEMTGEDDLFWPRSDHQLEARVGAACGKIDWDWIDREIAPLYSDRGRHGIATHFVIDSYSSTSTDYPTRACASAGSTPVPPALDRRGVFPAFPHERSEAAQRKAGTSPGREPAAGARKRRATHARSKRVTVDTTVEPKSMVFLIASINSGASRTRGSYSMRVAREHIASFPRDGSKEGENASSRSLLTPRTLSAPNP